MPWDTIEKLRRYIDKITQGLRVIKANHSMIHSGKHFFISDFETLGTDSQLEFGINVPPEYEIHITFEVFGQSRTEVLLYEGSDISFDGTSLTPQNNRRATTSESVVTIQENPTINSVGTNISASSKGSESQGNQAPNVGPHERGREIVMKPDTTYIFRVISRDSDNIVSYKTEWYEVAQ